MPRAEKMTYGEDFFPGARSLIGACAKIREYTVSDIYKNEWSWTSDVPKFVRPFYNTLQLTSTVPIFDHSARSLIGACAKIREYTVSDIYKNEWSWTSDVPKFAKNKRSQN